MLDDRSSNASAPLEGRPERSGGSPSRGAEPDPKVTPRSRRRQFSADYKARIVREAEACRDDGKIGALLRREGLYSSQLGEWRRQLERHGVEGLGAKKRGPAPKPKPSARELQLEREKRKLEKELAKAKAVIGRASCRERV